MVSLSAQLDLSNREFTALHIESIRESQRSAEHLNASHNQLSNAVFLKCFTSLKTINLDYNHFLNLSSFPVVEGLDTLSLNCNRLEGLDRIVSELAVRFPHLRHLSMLNNPCCPTFNPHATEDENLYYRYALIYALPWLTTLDGSEVSKVDRSSALAYMRRSEDGPKRGEERKKGKTKKRAVDSEGNRFITNADL